MSLYSDWTPTTLDSLGQPLTLLRFIARRYSGHRNFDREACAHVLSLLSLLDKLGLEVVRL